MSLIDKLKDEKQKEYKNRIQEENNVLLNEHCKKISGEIRDPNKIYHSNVKVKRENWKKFSEFIENQFNHGGEKYALPGQLGKEATDLLCEISPGKTGIDWIFQMIVKYCTRYINFEREKDLFKIATFAYIAWIKKGYHLQEEHDEDVERNG